MSSFFVDQVLFYFSKKSTVPETDAIAFAFASAVVSSRLDRDVNRCSDVSFSGIKIRENEKLILGGIWRQSNE